MNTTLIFTFKVDHSERLVNAKHILDYYHSFGYKIVVLHQGDESWNDCPEYVDYNIVRDSPYGLFKKGENYNIGAKCHRGSDILCFMDIDVLINVDELNKTIDAIKATDVPGTGSWALIGYNRTAIYFNYAAKEKILAQPLSYDFCTSLIDFNKLKTGDVTENYIVGNTKAVGGCLVMPRKTFNDINGFNPFIVGWGYDDDEIISRLKILEIPIYKVSSSMLYHLPHGESTADKSNHPHYKQNEAICQFVESLNKEQLKRYIKQW